MSRFPRFPRTVAFALLTAVLLPAGGCKDDQGDPVGPDTGPLDGEGHFVAALLSARTFAMMNRFAEETLDIYESGATLPVILPSCLGDGTATIRDNADSDPRTFSVRFVNYVIDCGSFPLTLNTDDAIDGKMVITFLETSPGLIYEIDLPWDGYPLFRPRGASIQLPTDQGGFILAASTPGGPLLFQLVGPRVGGQEVAVHVGGTLRLEDRSQPLLVVEEVRLEYAFNDDVIPKFAEWPGGSYEIAGFSGGGGFGFGGATPGYPVDVYFDGLGGVAFPVDDRTCVGNMATGENPCEGL